MNCVRIITDVGGQLINGSLQYLKRNCLKVMTICLLLNGQKYTAGSVIMS